MGISRFSFFFFTLFLDPRLLQTPTEPGQKTNKQKKQLIKRFDNAMERYAPKADVLRSSR